MSRKMRYWVLGVAMLLAGGFAAYAWLRPYAWSSDPAARYRIVASQVKQDHANYWLNVHLKLRSGVQDDPNQPVVLITAAGREHKPANVMRSGPKGQAMDELWLGFWLEREDFDGALRLKMHEGELLVRQFDGLPKLGDDGLTDQFTNRW